MMGAPEILPGLPQCREVAFGRCALLVDWILMGIDVGGICNMSGTL